LFCTGWYLFSVFLHIPTTAKDKNTKETIEAEVIPPKKSKSQKNKKKRRK
jgi:hypothetical protein